LSTSSTRRQEARMMNEPPSGSDDGGRGIGGGAIATIGGLGLLVVFMAQNTDDVTVHFLAWDFTWPVWLVILLSAVVGAFVWLGLGILRRHRRRKARRAARRG
jgi:uncharacterized integral membrane protein